MAAVWCVERTRSARFPYRISIEQDGRLLFAVRARSAWPAPGAQIFCLREDGFDSTEPLEPCERVPIAALSRIGVKLAVVLDRPSRKRCEFLSLRKPRKDGSDTTEQVFFRTESAIRAHRTKGRVELAARTALDVVVDARERHPWRFPGAQVTRRALPAGDYALVRDERILAVVERKSFANLLHDIGALRALHQQLADLASQRAAAVVVEAQYGDFLDASRTAPWPAAHVARVLAEIAALHPRLPVVFAGNRKLANLWAVRWFAAIAADTATPLPLFVSDVVARYEGGAPGLDQRLREAALLRLPSPFRVGELRASVPEADARRVTRILDTLHSEGRLRRIGHGRGAAWQRS